jgi:hypothetical protein
MFQLGVHTHTQTHTDTHTHTHTHTHVMSLDLVLYVEIDGWSSMLQVMSGDSWASAVSRSMFADEEHTDHSVRIYNTPFSIRGFRVWDTILHSLHEGLGFGIQYSILYTRVWGLGFGVEKTDHSVRIYNTPSDNISWVLTRFLQYVPLCGVQNARSHSHQYTIYFLCHYEWWFRY